MKMLRSVIFLCLSSSFAMAGFFIRSVVLQMSTDNLKDSQLPSITGGGLRGRYIFDQLHFHWSSDLIEGGSEHTINHTHYPCELHLVHMNSKYANLTAAANHADGIAVLGVLMEESKKSNIPMRHFINLIGSAHNKKYILLNVKPAFPLMGLLPDETDSFYRYSGSLTTPGCQESVTWTLFDSSVQISTRQITKLATLVDENGKSLAHNNRPVQPLNYRKVKHYNTTPGASRRIY